MATLALAAPTIALGSNYGTGPGVGLNLPAAETSIAANTGFSFPNNGWVMLRVVYGTVVGTINFVIQKQVEGVTPAPIVPNSTISVPYIYGPFDTAEFNDVNGLFQANWTGFTGGSVGVYQLPANRYGQ